MNYLDQRKKIVCAMSKSRKQGGRSPHHSVPEIDVAIILNRFCLSVFYSCLQNEVSWKLEMRFCNKMKSNTAVTTIVLLRSLAVVVSSFAETPFGIQLLPPSLSWSDVASHSYIDADTNLRIEHSRNHHHFVRRRTQQREQLQQQEQQQHKETQQSIIAEDKYNNGTPKKEDYTTNNNAAIIMSSINSLSCHISVITTYYNSSNIFGGYHPWGKEETLCTPQIIRNEINKESERKHHSLQEESDESFPIQLPDELYQTFKKEVSQGSLYVDIPRSQTRMVKGKIVIDIAPNQEKKNKNDAMATTTNSMIKTTVVRSSSSSRYNNNDDTKERRRTQRRRRRHPKEDETEYKRMDHRSLLRQNQQQRQQLKQIYEPAPEQERRRLLVLRISTSDSEPTLSLDDIRDSVFGGYIDRIAEKQNDDDEEEGKDEKVSLYSQMYSCSAGTLLLEPANVTTVREAAHQQQKSGERREGGEGFVPGDIQGGVVNVELSNHTISDFDSILEIVNKAQGTLKAMLGLDPSIHIMDQLFNVEYANNDIDHILFCLPPGSPGGDWVASAAVNHYRSIFNDVNCGRISVLMHEIGHNLGLHHASHGNKSYMDRTGYMGIAQTAKYNPKKCYNGQNHWELGWFSNRAMKLNYFTRPRILHLATFVDYHLTTDTEYVLINIIDQYYVQYNRAKHHNIGTGSMENQVTIVTTTKADATTATSSTASSVVPVENENLDKNTTVSDDDDGPTNLLIGLDMDTPIFRIPNFQGTNSDLVIEICEMQQQSEVDNNDPAGISTTAATTRTPDKAIISIALDVSTCAEARF